ncbi:MAG: chromosomal replication initiator protein DnaA [Bacillota bacterium]|uniref:chromosomal replication initiator protein DnaA n=1 Tax=Desulforudis sp. DRI-14 TaxID=3459793 RepID=UPI00346EC902
MVPAEILEAWQQVLKALDQKLNRQSFEHWLKPLKPIAFYNNTILIEVPNNFSRDWLNERYTPMIKQCFEQVTGCEVGLRFLLSREVPDIVHNLSARPLEKNEDNIAQLNPRYTFDSFVVGNSNRFAHAASQAVAEAPARAYNPLFIYGGVGLGKTHLMHAIGHYILQKSGYLRVSYVTSEKFTNELINSIRDDQTAQFRARYRSIDILLIDDIQFLAGKERTQEEFFHTFNTLYEAAKQIVVSSDRPPKEIPTLEERLRSRFEWGLITDIQPPDLETRVAILRKKAQAEAITVPDETLLYIADRIQSNIRELEGAFNRVVAFATLTNAEITSEMAAQVLKDIVPPKKPRQINCTLIQEIVADYFRLRPDELKAKRRTRNVAFPRQVAMYLVRELTDLSLPKIGQEFGGRDHTTVLHACEKIAEELTRDQSLQDLVAALLNRIKED